MTEAESSRLPQTGSVTVKVLIPNYLAGALIGKGGEELNIIRKQTGGIIKLSQNKAYYPGTDERVVLIKGRPDSAFALLKLVHSKIRTRKAPPIINGRPFNEIRLQQMKLIIANSTAGKIIGTGGEVIKQIQGEYNVKLFITNVDNPKEKRIQNERICTLKGDELSVNRCMIDIVERIAADEMADLDTNIDYPKCEDGDVIFGMERQMFMPGIGMVPAQMAGLHQMAGGGFEDLFMLQEQTKALQAMSSLAAGGGGGMIQMNPMVSMASGFPHGQMQAHMGGGLLGAQPGLQFMMDPYKGLALKQRQDLEILTPEMAMMKEFNGNIMVDQYADPFQGKQPQQTSQLQAMLMQNPALAAQQHAHKSATEQLATQEQQFLIPNSLTGALGRRAAQPGVPASHQQELLNRANGLTTSGIYQSPLMSHVASSNNFAAQTAAIQQAAQNAALQQQIQLQALQQQQQQQQTQPNPLLAQQTQQMQPLQMQAFQESQLHAIQESQLQAQAQAQAAQLQAMYAGQNSQLQQSNQLHCSNVAQAQLHAQMQAQVQSQMQAQMQAQLQAQIQNQAAAAHHSGVQHSKSKRYHPYGIPPPPPPPAELAPAPPKQVSVAPQVQAAPTVSVSVAPQVQAAPTLLTPPAPLLPGVPAAGT